MKRFYTYMILAMVGMLFSCQKPELTDQGEDFTPGEGVYGEATVSFSALLPVSPETKAMGDTPTDDIESLHLVIFDANGMLVETREANFQPASATHGEHLYERKFEVTLSITDKKRIIHFIANCPVDQIAYGHEASIIGNLYVTKGADKETAYWARAEVSDLLVDIVDVDKKIGEFKSDAVQAAFTCVPMLRNYAHIIVKNSAQNFIFEEFYVYNTINIGTVAPYNNKIQGFQSFLDSTGKKYSYPDLMSLVDDGGNSVSYEGHALASARLDQSVYGPVKLQQTQDGSIVSQPYYLYERRISVNGNDESIWHESPVHLIIKGKHGSDAASSYYKVDLIYKTETVDGIQKDEYYNILRNFRYQFTITSVEKTGYPSIEAAITGAPNNILSGSTTTTKFTNISDRNGRLWVSYTDITLVEEGTVKFMYKYISDIDPEDGEEVEICNGIYSASTKKGHIILEDMIGNVISDYSVAESDIVGGEWDGFREVTLTINQPSDVTQKQSIIVRTADNPDLSREIRFYLKRKLNLDVVCVQKKVPSKIGAEIEVDIKLPDTPEITEDMFPMDLAVEVWDMTLSPNLEENTFAVICGPSQIKSKNGAPAFYYVHTIDTYEQYKSIDSENGYKAIKTYWLTNVTGNQSSVYVTNKYFNEDYDSFVNAIDLNGRFDKQRLSVSENETVNYKFDVQAENLDVVFTIQLDRLELNGSVRALSTTEQVGVYTYTAQSAGTQTIPLKVKEGSEGPCTISITSHMDSGYTDVHDTIYQVDVETKTATLSFADATKRTERSDSRQQWVNGDIVFTNERNNATEKVRDNTNPIRIYQGQNLSVAVPDNGVITIIVFDCNNSTYANNLKNSISGKVVVSSDKVTVTLDGSSNEYVINKLSNEVRLDSITVTYEI